MDQKPSIGRIVHYTSREGEVRPAVVVRVVDQEAGTCNLAVFLDGPTDDRFPDLWPDSVEPLGVIHKASIAQGETCEPGTWSWPPRDEPATLDPPPPDLPTEPAAAEAPPALDPDEPFAAT